MKLTEYINQLQAISKEYPNLKVVYAQDAEGNGYDEVYFAPTLGVFDKHGDFDTGEHIKKPNAICIN